MNATRRPAPPWLQRPLRFFVLVFAGALLLALAGRGVRYAASAVGPSKGACWIWAPGVEPTGQQPVAFYAVGDFELQAAEPAKLSIAADEGYELWINGRSLGTGSYRPGTAIDRYRLDSVLRAGNNRVTVRAQSLRGPGGLLASARTLEFERTLTATSSGWRIFREHDPRLFDADAELDGGEMPEVWQRVPTGRWRFRSGDEDPPWTAGEPAKVLLPRGIRDFHPDAPWIDPRRPRKTPFRMLGILVDWGEIVTGKLGFELASPAAEPALAYLGREIPDPESQPADQVLLFVPGQTVWRDFRPRRFRYLLLVGLEPLAKVWVEPAPPVETLPLDPPGGIWGIPLPPRPPTLQERVWQRVREEAEERRAQRARK